MRNFGYILLLSGFGAFAQNDIGKKFKPILPGSNTTTTPTTVSPTLPTPSLFDKKPEEVKPLMEPERKGIMDQPQFVNAGTPYLKKLNKDNALSENQQAIRKDQYLGDIKTTSGTVNIMYRDHEFVDGDEIRIYANGIIARSNVTLDSDFQGFELPLNPGFNTIEFEALNQGSSGPNTAQLVVYNDKGEVISANSWNLATGFKATIIVIKQ
ncbi:MAG: hypothetical protein CFE23_10705 [Flavobacterium sp. BFFFF1]|uniref:hypothetical protein n=1 Tax=unclassified Flavobacterium TaxID=196869 RepID=UPI000BD5991E|nr:MULTISPECIES: hypothetical protein [unclassified Flavobacterium]OYU80180.1 MAG: hypothetical protein CFE23_10705 [Flavobacterium sp. BFFFF1]